MQKCKVIEEKLAHKENVIKVLQSADPFAEISPLLDSNELFQVKEENDKLKSIIKQMREEMESIAFSGRNSSSHNKLPDQNETALVKPLSANKEFENDLQKQLLDLKQRNRDLQSQIDDYLLKNKYPEKMTDNTVINTHIKSQNDTISNFFQILFTFIWAKFKVRLLLIFVVVVVL